MRKRFPVKQQQEQPRRYRYIDQKFTVLICLEEKISFNYFHSIFVEYIALFL